jgi:hypothetical protein
MDQTDKQIYDYMVVNQRNGNAHTDVSKLAADQPEFQKLNRINLFNEDVKSKKSNNYIWMIFYFILLAILVAIFFMFI